MSKRFFSKQRAELLATILRGAADLVGRSPYPLVASAEAFGVHFESPTFSQIKAVRDLSWSHQVHDAGYVHDEVQVLLRAAVIVEECWA